MAVAQLLETVGRAIARAWPSPPAAGPEGGGGGGGAELPAGAAAPEVGAAAPLVCLEMTWRIRMCGLRTAQEGTANM